MDYEAKGWILRVIYNAVMLNKEFQSVFSRPVPIVKN